MTEPKKPTSNLTLDTPEPDKPNYGKPGPRDIGIGEGIVAAGKEALKKTRPQPKQLADAQAKLEAEKPPLKKMGLLTDEGYHEGTLKAIVGYLDEEIIKIDRWIGQHKNLATTGRFIRPMLQQVPKSHMFNIGHAVDMAREARVCLDMMREDIMVFGKKEEK